MNTALIVQAYVWQLFVEKCDDINDINFLHLELILLEGKYQDIPTQPCTWETN